MANVCLREDLMSNEERCKQTDRVLPALLCEVGLVSQQIQAHFEMCSVCREEFHAMQRTMKVMQAWGAPECSPLWATRMSEKLRGEEFRKPLTYSDRYERLRTRIWLSHTPMRHLAYATTIALAALMIMSLHFWPDGGQAFLLTQTCAVVIDLQSLDDNAQIFQQLYSMEEAGDTKAEPK